MVKLTPPPAGVQDRLVYDYLDSVKLSDLTENQF